MNIFSNITKINQPKVHSCNITFQLYNKRDKSVSWYGSIVFFQFKFTFKI